jgi:hypothetical protein
MDDCPEDKLLEAFREAYVLRPEILVRTARTRGGARIIMLDGWRHDVVANHAQVDFLLTARRRDNEAADDKAVELEQIDSDRFV